MRAGDRTPRADRVRAVRIALLSPYSWTYPGASRATSRRSPQSLRADGHEPRILAPFDPDDALSRRLHRGARPQPRPVPEGFVSLGRTIGFPANGAVSNICADPARRVQAAPRAARRRLRRRPHPRAGRARRRLGRALLGRRAAARRHLPHLLRERPHQRLRGGPARRAAADEPPARAHRRLRGGRLDGAALLRRALPDHPQRRAPAGAGDSHRGRRARRARSASCGSCSSARPSNARACRSCCAPSRRCASTCPRRSRSSARRRRRSPT